MITKEQRDLIQEIRDLTGGWLTPKSNMPKVYQCLLRLARLGGYPSDEAENYDADQDGMREIVRLQGQSSIPILISIAKKFPGIEWYRYVAEVLVEMDDPLAEQALKDLERTGDKNLRNEVIYARARKKKK
jgi:hypothetical protein